MPVTETVGKQDLPLLSVIVPTFNRVKYLERCLLSLFHEIETDYPNTEVIVIDGGSTDGTVEILKKYDHKIAYWVSESDSGCSEAVNKGLAKAKGEFIRLLGDDDELISGWFSQTVKYLMAHSDIDVIIAHADFYSQNSLGEISPLAIKQPVGKVTYRDFLRIGEIGWPSPEVALTRRSVYQRLGGYDTRYHYLAYLEIWLRFAKAGIAFKAIPEVIAKRYLTTQSDTIKGDPERISKELQHVLKLHGDIRWQATRYYPEKVKRFLFYPIVRFCSVFNIHPLQAKRRIISRLKSTVNKKAAQAKI